MEYLFSANGIVDDSAGDAAAELAREDARIFIDCQDILPQTLPVEESFNDFVFEDVSPSPTIPQLASNTTLNEIKKLTDISNEGFLKIMEVDDENATRLLKEIRELKSEFSYKLEQTEERLQSMQKESVDLKTKIDALVEKLNANTLVVSGKIEEKSNNMSDNVVNILSSIFKRSDDDNTIE